MYRDIWATKDESTPQVGDYVEGPYGERGVILSRESNPDSFWVGLFGETGNNSVREVPHAAFPGRWDVRR